jgi:hypothetical protein
MYGIFQVNPAMTSLDFRWNGISAGSVSKLCAALSALSTSKYPQVGPRVRHLNLLGNVLEILASNPCAN